MTLDSDLTARWRRVERGLSHDLERVAKNLAAAHARGQNVQTWMLSADPGWLNLAQQLGTEARRFSAYAAVEIARAAETSAALGSSEVRGYLKQLGVEGYPSGKAREFQERQAAYRYLLEQGVPAEALQGMQRSMLDAASKGQTAAQVAEAGRTGMSRGLNRAMLVSRDQQARSRREQIDAEYLATGRVAMKQRITRRAGACPICLALDGEVIPVEQPSYEPHPGGYCDWKPVLIGQKPLRRSAESWLRSQPAEYQREVLGNARYEAFRDGLDLASQVVTTWHPTWGKGAKLAPLPTAPIGV